MHSFVDRDVGIVDDDIGRFLGLEEFVSDFQSEDYPRLLDTLRKQKETLESRPPSSPKLLKKNLKKLTKLIPLNKTEREILAFSLYLQFSEPLDDTVRFLGDIGGDRIYRFLSRLLHRPIKKVKAALAPDATLARSGLLRLDRSKDNALRNKLELFDDEFAHYMLSEDIPIEAMIRESVRPASAGTLGMEDYDHLAKDLALLLGYLRRSIQERRSGVNILLYGPPGTGKTELAKALAQALGRQLYEISYADRNDEAIEGGKRLAAYRMAQSLFARSQTLLMFDEVEDVLRDANASALFAPPRQEMKGWINRTLESNPVPTIWISNSIRGMDAATIRRFDMTLQLPIPPKKKRRQILRRHLGDLLDEPSLRRIAKHPGVAPALVSRSARVAQSCGSDDPRQAFLRILNHTLEAQGQRPVAMKKRKKRSKEPALPASYDLGFIHSDRDPRELVEGIRRHPHARLCLYGVPGTGKSAFGRYLAKELGRTCLLKKGSDLLSMWVGGTEKNIADAFAEARKKKAVLIFDEVDSFLADRRDAQRSWERTQVNEMLTQMESFEGIFIATTNLMEGLDPASLRRFDLKMKFDYLRADQAWELFLRECEALGLPIKGRKSLRRRLSAIRQLAPGDFAAIRRQHRFSPIDSAQAFLQRLQAEVEVKEARRVKMGFLA